ncbi:MAG: protease modulator HflC [Rhodobiaceae bacterium]|nr:protease modulator HflC [Rhodobiaceae bacterium]
MGSRSSILVIIVLAILGIAYSATFVVTERDQAIVMRFGEIKRVIRTPGLYFKVPTNFVDTVQVIDRRMLRIVLEDKVVQVRDGRQYVVDAFATFRIADPQRFRETVQGNLSQASTRLQTRFDSALRRVYGLRDFDAALSEQRSQMMDEARDLIRPEALDLGIEIVDVRIQRTDLLPQVSKQTFERMSAERLAEAAQLRALGTQESIRIRAEADRKAVVEIANARKQSEILRGEGDGERNRVFAGAFSKDPEFFAFYRSLKAYEVSTDSGDTTMVLSPDSQFFRYFGTPAGAQPRTQ